MGVDVKRYLMFGAIGALSGVCGGYVIDHGAYAVGVSLWVIGAAAWVASVGSWLMGE